MIFTLFFWNGQRSVMEPGPTPSPWSICFSAQWLIVKHVIRLILFIKHGPIEFEFLVLVITVI